MLRIEPQKENESNPWAVIGAGPVGSMLTALLTTLFPDQEIHAFDKRHVHIRGHGLDIKNATINQINELLSELAHETRVELANNGDKVDAAKRKYYENILERITTTQNYLREEVGGHFIRTFQISDMLQQHSRSLSNEKANFHMDMEITEEDLAALGEQRNAADAPELNEKQKILKNADWTFGADGSHSGVRRVVFGEGSDDLRKDVLTYLLEIKLEMNNKEEASSFADKLNRSILPTIKTGHVHIWNQSMDGTATLHVFVDKKVYDALHVKDKNGKYLGEFANPYRRLTDLPDDLKNEIERIIVNVIDANKIDTSTIKVTTIPMHVYKARQLVKMIHQKRFALVGDSGVGLVLARGVNFGFFAAAMYAAGMYREQLKKTFHPEQVADFDTYQRFWDDQHQKLDQLITWLDLNIHVPGNDARELAYRQINILDEYEKLYLRILALSSSLTKDEHKDAVKNIAAEFERFILAKANISTHQIISKHINDLFTNLMDKDYLAQHKITDLHHCQSQLLAHANEKIGDAKFEVKLIHGMAKVYETSSSIISSSKMDDDEPALEEAVAKPVKLALQKLLGVIKSFNMDQHPEQAHFIFRMDRMYLELERYANKWSNVSTKIKRIQLIRFIETTSKYLQELPRIGTRAAIEFSHEAPEYISKSLIKEIVESGNYTFNEVRSLQEKDANYFIAQGKKSLETLIGIENNRSGLLYHLFGDDTDKNRELKYQLLLNKDDSPELMEALGLITLYALFNNHDAKHLCFSMLKNMLDPALNKKVNELDVQVMREVLQKKITDKLQTQQFNPAKRFATYITQAINLGNTDEAIAQFSELKKMLTQLAKLRQVAPAELIARTLGGISEYKRKKDAGEYDSYISTSLSSISKVSSSKELDDSYDSFGKVSKLFKAAPRPKPAYELILENKDNDQSESGMLIRLSIVYALLNSHKNMNLTSEIAISISANGVNNRLDFAQVSEHIENILKAHIPQEKLTQFSSNMHKLTAGINSGSKLEKELLRLNDMFKQTARVEEKPACAFGV